MKDERLINMLAKFVWGIRLEPGHPYKHPPNGRLLQVNQVWLADDRSAATRQDILVYCTIGDRDPVLVCYLRSSNHMMPVQTSFNLRDTEQAIFSVVGPGGVYLAGSYIEDLVRECQISAKATCGDNKSQSPGDKIGEETEVELDKEAENNNDKMKLDDKVNVDEQAKGKGDSLDMPVPYLAEVVAETTKEDRATTPSSEGLNLLASVPLPLTELERKKKTKEQTNNGNAADKENLNYPLKTRECLITSKDNMKKESNGFGGRRRFRIHDFVLIGGEKKRNGRRRLRKKDMSIDDADIDGEKKRNGSRRLRMTDRSIDGEKKRNGWKRLRKKDMSIDDAHMDGEKKRNGWRRLRKKDMSIDDAGIDGEKKRNGWKRLRMTDRSIDDVDIDGEKKRSGWKRLRKKDMSIDDPDVDGEKKRNGRKREKHQSTEFESDDDVDIDGEYLEKRNGGKRPRLIKKDPPNESNGEEIDMSGADNKLQASAKQTNKETEGEFGAVRMCLNSAK